MIFQTALLGSLLLAGHASARRSALLQRSDDIETLLRRDADLMASLTKRQDSNSADNTAPQQSTTPVAGDVQSIDLAKWEEDTRRMCDAAMVVLGAASNPTGLAVCYNVPLLNNTSGEFQAELRMYNISAPIDPWIGVTAADINMDVAYRGANISGVSMNGTVQKREELSWPPIKDNVVKRQNNGAPTPQQIKVVTYVGRLNQTYVAELGRGNVTQAVWQELLAPEIGLRAKSPSGGPDLVEVLAASEASFLNGVFAQRGGDTVFTLPGTNLAFFPIGLLITCIWTGGFFLAVGFGTFGRMQFREQYRRRVQREIATNMRTL